MKVFIAMEARQWYSLFIKQIMKTLQVYILTVDFTLFLDVKIKLLLDNFKC